MMKRIFLSLLSVLVGLGVISLGVVVVIGLVARPVTADVAVVLGNTVLPDGAPSPRLRARLDEAVFLFRAGRVRRIVVSGGIEPGQVSEPESMRRYLLTAGVPDMAILTDDTGVNTFATARALARMVPQKASVVVVSQWFHLARADLALRRCGFRHVSVAAPQYFEARDMYSLVREGVGLPYYAVFHRGCL